MDKFVTENETAWADDIPCNSCEHLDRENTDGFTCKAFPDGIPEQILDGENSHRKPLIGQGNRIIYKKEKGR